MFTLSKQLSWLLIQNVTFCDTETTGLNTDYYYSLFDGKRKIDLMEKGQECRIIELAGMRFGKQYEGFYSDINKTDILVSPIAASTHGYTMKMLKDAPEFDKTDSFKKLNEDISNGNYIVFHNAPFDEKMLNIHNVELRKDRVIDTLRVCKHLYKDGLIGLDDTEYYNVFSGEVPENHKLQYFRYLFEMDDQPYFKEAMALAGLDEVKPHTALSDVFILWLFTAKLMQDFNLTLDDMVELTSKPILEERFKLGKMRSQDSDSQKYENIIASESVTTWGAVNPGYEYFVWVYDNMNLSPDMEFSINYWMGKAILDGRIPFTNVKGKDYIKFLYNAMRTSFNKKEILQALAIMNKEEAYYMTVLDNIEKRTLKELSCPFEPTNPQTRDKELSIRENRLFFYDYVNKYRKDIV